MQGTNYNPDGENDLEKLLFAMNELKNLRFQPVNSI